MRVVRTLRALRASIDRFKKDGKRIGFVPTMGALHDGHLSLARRARRENDVVVMSIFVNPKQFGPKEDFKAYPRPEKKDISLAKKEKVDIIFYPSEKIMYPAGFLTSVEVASITSRLCGASRPGHFRGVTTVVAKLLNQVRPDRLYVGQKDAQQAVIIKRMVRDLDMPVTVRVCPIVREPDGLAMSSRNQYLTADQRTQAAFLFRSLKKAGARIRDGERSAPRVAEGIRSMIAETTSGRIDYIACVDAKTLEPLKQLRGDVLIALAVKFGHTRLIDNIIVRL